METSRHPSRNLGGLYWTLCCGVFPLINLGLSVAEVLITGENHIPYVTPVIAIGLEAVFLHVVLRRRDAHSILRTARTVAILLVLTAIWGFALVVFSVVGSHDNS